MTQEGDVFAGIRWGVDQMGLPGSEVELTVEYQGRFFGRYVMVPTPGKPGLASAGSWHQLWLTRSAPLSRPGTPSAPSDESTAMTLSKTVSNFGRCSSVANAELRRARPGSPWRFVAALVSA